MKVSDQANNLRPRAQVYRAHNAKKLQKMAHEKNLQC